MRIGLKFSKELPLKKNVKKNAFLSLNIDLSIYCINEFHANNQSRQ